MPREPDKNNDTKKIRASVSFHATDYSELERIATKKKVSVAWVVRDAVEQYLTNEEPLFRREQERE